MDARRPHGELAGEAGAVRALRRAARRRRPAPRRVLPRLHHRRVGVGRAVGVRAHEHRATARAHQHEHIAALDAMLARPTPSTRCRRARWWRRSIQCLLLDRPGRFPLNIPNEGQVADLPLGAMVEGMCIVDGGGVRGSEAVSLPAAMAEALRRVSASQELTVDAAVSGDRDAAFAAMLLDPLARSSRLRRHRGHDRRDARGHRRVAAAVRQHLSGVGCARPQARDSPQSIWRAPVRHYGALLTPKRCGGEGERWGSRCRGGSGSRPGRNRSASRSIDADGRAWTAGELLAGANRLVHALRARGVQPFDPVATLMPQHGRAVPGAAGGVPGRAGSTCRSTRTSPRPRSRTSSATPVPTALFADARLADVARGRGRRAPACRPTARHRDRRRHPRLHSLRRRARRPARHDARRPRRRAVHAVHVGHDRAAEGGAARPADVRSRDVGRGCSAPTSPATTSSPAVTRCTS